MASSWLSCVSDAALSISRPQMMSYWFQAAGSDLHYIQNSLLARKECTSLLALPFSGSHYQTLSSFWQAGCLQAVCMKCGADDLTRYQTWPSNVHLWICQFILLSADRSEILCLYNVVHGIDHWLLFKNFYYYFVMYVDILLACMSVLYVCVHRAMETWREWWIP